MDNRAIWKRGRNLEFIVKKLQGAITKVEKWSNKWSFKFSRIGSEIKLNYIIKNWRE